MHEHYFLNYNRNKLRLISWLKREIEAVFANITIPSLKAPTLLAIHKGQLGRLHARSEIQPCFLSLFGEGQFFFKYGDICVSSSWKFSSFLSSCNGWTKSYKHTFSFSQFFDVLDVVLEHDVFGCLRFSDVEDGKMTGSSQWVEGGSGLSETRYIGGVNAHMNIIEWFHARHFLQYKDGGQSMVLNERIWTLP